MNSHDTLPANRPEVDLTLFVACYNEEKNIRGTLGTLRQALADFDFKWEIIIIDDCSADNSVIVVREFMAGHPELPVYLKINETNRGLGYNFTECAFLGKGKYYRLICGDDVEPAETFRTVFGVLGQADMVLCRQTCTERTFLRRALSRTYNWLVNTIGGYNVSYYHGLAMHLRYNVVRWHSRSEGFGFQADLITRLLDQGVGYIEVETQARERETGNSKALHFGNFLSVAHMFQELLIRRVKRQMRLPRERKRDNAPTS
ncbi:MAG: glycosyltransferase family 2 protein [Akkermansiaceae bacterium]